MDICLFVSRLWLQAFKIVMTFELNVLGAKAKRRIYSLKFPSRFKNDCFLCVYFEVTGVERDLKLFRELLVNTITLKKAPNGVESFLLSEYHTDRVQKAFSTELNFL